MSTDDPHLETQALVASLQKQHTLAGTQITRGIMFVLLVPVVGVAMLALMLAFDSMWPLIMFAVYALAGGAFGAVSIILGSMSLRSAGKQLKEIEGERIPKARLLT